MLHGLLEKAFLGDPLPSIAHRSYLSNIPTRILPHHACLQRLVGAIEGLSPHLIASST